MTAPLDQDPTTPLVQPESLPRLIEPEHFVRDREILLRYIEGQPLKDIAQAKQLTEAQVKAILKKRAIKQEISRLSAVTNEKWLAERMEALSMEALDVLRSTMRGDNISELKFKAAKATLDLNPTLKAKPESNPLMKELGEGIGEAIIQRLTRMDAAAAPALDVTPVTEPPPAIPEGDPNP